MHGTTERRQNPVDDYTIQLAQDQPFRAAGCTRNGSYAFLCKTPVFDVLERCWSCLEEQSICIQKSFPGPQTLRGRMQARCENLAEPLLTISIKVTVYNHGRVLYRKRQY